jgi:beta-aspartyl-peptidase (threonine type)
VAFSGDGEQIARKMLAARIMFTLENSRPDAALDEALEHVASIGGEAGGIVLTPQGEFGWKHNSQNFAVALQHSDDTSPRLYLHKREEVE